MTPFYPRFFGPVQTTSTLRGPLLHCSGTELQVAAVGVFKVTICSLGNDETCVNIMRLVHAVRICRSDRDLSKHASAADFEALDVFFDPMPQVIEGGGTMILEQAGLTAVLISKIKVLLLILRRCLCTLFFDRKAGQQPDASAAYDRRAAELDGDRCSPESVTSYF